VQPAARNTIPLAPARDAIRIRGEACDCARSMVAQRATSRPGRSRAALHNRRDAPAVRLRASKMLCSLSEFFLLVVNSFSRLAMQWDARWRIVRDFRGRREARQKLAGSFGLRTMEKGLR